MYNLIEYSANYSKTSRSLWKCWDKPALTNAGAIVYFHDPNKSASLKFKQKIKQLNGKTGAGNGKNLFEIMVSLKDSTNFWSNF